MDNNRGGFRGNRNSSKNGGNFRRNQDNYRGGSSGYRDQGPKEMHKATCADCNAECEVPFKPSGDRPVYCRDCFSKHKKY